MLSKQQSRTAVCIRMDPADRRLIGRAANDERMSINAYVLGAALERARSRADRTARANGPAYADLTHNAEAAAALEVLESAGLTAAESARRVRRALAADAAANAERLVALAFGMCVNGSADGKGAGR